MIVLTYRGVNTPETIEALGKWMAEGKIKYRLDIVDGLAHADATLRKLFTGDHKGKLMIRVSDPG